MEAVLVVDDDGLVTFEGHDDEAVDLLEAAWGLLFSINILKMLEKFIEFGKKLTSEEKNVWDTEALWAESRIMNAAFTQNYELIKVES